ncbi:MAG: hypothetical protein OEV66_02995 [Spirochaetia bacterium]|nr:hypothetical protein [Spirochaetia bacterium]
MANWFVAFKIPPEKWFQELVQQLPADLKAFHPEDLHLTIAFLGGLNLHLKSAIFDLLQKFYLDPLTITSSKFLFLPSEKKYSAICLDFRQGFESVGLHDLFMETMHAIRNEILIVAQAEQDMRNFLPHITVARPGRNISSKDRHSMLLKIKQTSIPQIRIRLDTIGLYTWDDDRRTNSRGISNFRQFKTVFEKQM